MSNYSVVFTPRFLCYRLPVSAFTGAVELTLLQNPPLITVQIILDSMPLPLLGQFPTSR